MSTSDSSSESSSDSSSESSPEQKWEPLPPINSQLSLSKKKKKMMERNYSPVLRTYMLSGKTPEQPTSQLDEYFKDKSKSNCLYYTYALVDPRIHVNDKPDFEAFVRGVFYIGKGKDGRCADHFFKTGLQGKCRGCKQAYCLEDMMIPAHEGNKRGCSSPKAPRKIKCAGCLGFIEVRQEKFVSHFSSEDCDAKKHEYSKKCHFCDCVVLVHETKDRSHYKGAIKHHVRQCNGTNKVLKKRKCPDCGKKVAVRETKDVHPIGTIKPHSILCEGIGEILEKGECAKCKQSVEIYQRKTPSSEKGDMKCHQLICSKSGELPPKIVLDIKDKKISSIWKAGGTPTAVVLTQGDTEEHAKQKEAMMMMAYGKHNISTQESGGYMRGKLVNKKMESVSDLGSSVCASECRKYGVNLLLKAWKTYCSTSTCAARIMWPSNPKEVQSSDDDDSGDDSVDGTAEEQEEEEIEV